MWEPEVLGAHDHFVKCMAVLPDGRLVSADENRYANIWPMTGGAPVRLEGHRDAISVLVPVGSDKLVTGSWDRTIALWHTGTGERIRRYRGHIDRVDRVAVCQRTSTLISADESGLICEFRLRDGTPLSTWACHDNRVRALVVDGDGWISVGDDGKMVRRRWTDTEPQVILEWDTPIYSVLFSYKDRAIVAADACRRPFVLHSGGVGRGRCPYSRRSILAVRPVVA